MIKRYQSNGRLSHIVEYPLSGNVVVLSGQVAENRDVDITGQTKDVLATIDRLLAEAGVSKEKSFRPRSGFPISAILMR